MTAAGSVVVAVAGSVVVGYIAVGCIVAEADNDAAVAGDGIAAAADLDSHSLVVEGGPIDPEAAVPIAHPEEVRILHHTRLEEDSDRPDRDLALDTCC